MTPQQTFCVWLSGWIDIMGPSEGVTLSAAQIAVVKAKLDQANAPAPIGANIDPPTVIAAPLVNPLTSDAIATACDR